MQTVSIHTFKDNRPLSERERRRGLAVLSEVRRCVDARAGFESQHNLDVRFSQPGAMWANCVTGLRHLADIMESEPRNFDLLRFNVQIFTGFDLRLYARESFVSPEVWKAHSEKYGGSLVHPPEEGFDAQLSERIQSAHPVMMECWANLIQHTPLDLFFIPPPVCGEVGAVVNGVIVNHDTAVYQERLTLFGWLGIFRFLKDRIAQEGVVRILEIGGGYGALARQIKRIVPNAAYTICDLPESLYASAAYLSAACPDLDMHVVTPEAREVDAIDALHFLPNYALPVFAKDYRFDLVINTLSMAEMSELQARRYGELVSQMISGTGLFFEQNQDNSHVPGGLNCKQHLPRYFLRRNQIPAIPFQTGQGQIDVWSNRVFRLPYN